MLRVPALVLLFFLVGGLAQAGAAESVLERIAETGAFRIGFVSDAPPLSFVDEDGTASGYSIDLCRHIAFSIRDELGLDEIDLEFTRLVSMEDRQRAVEDGLVDIECGATTVTLSRRERVDFTLMTFITGSAVLSRRSDPIVSMEDIAGKRIAVIHDTTTEAVLRDFVEVNDSSVRLVLIETHDRGMELLNEGKIDGYASDRAMLIGQVFRGANAEREYTMTRNVLSFEPYALMVPRGDTRFRLSADRALASLYRSARILRLHHNWFGQYGEPLSPIVEAMYQFQAVGE